MRITTDKNGLSQIEYGDGMVDRLAQFQGHIAHVKVPHSGVRRGKTHKDETAVITSLLVVPQGHPGIPLEAYADGLGALSFHFWDKGAVFHAPVLALMNRYHGLTKAAVMTERMRLAAGLSTDHRDDFFAQPLVQPIRIGPYMEFSLRSTGTLSWEPLTVEIQALVNRGMGITDDVSPDEFFRWEPIDG